MLYLYGIPNCDTVKKARTFLENKGFEYVFVDFKKSAPTLELIDSWSKVFGGLPVNTKGTTYKKYKDEFESLSESKKREFLIKNSSMIKRPILQDNKKVLSFGFDESDYKAKLGK